MTRKLTPRSLECNSRNIKGRHERLRVDKDDLTKEVEKDKHDRKKPSETWTQLEEFGDLQDLLTFRRPNPCYIPTLDATIVSSHFVWCFSDSHKIKICLFKTIVCIVCIPLSLLSHPETLDPIEDEWRWTHICGTNKSIGDGPMDSEQGRSHEE